MTSGAADPLFTDTNILVYTSVTAAPFHQVALRSLERLYDAGTELWVSRQVLREYLAARSRPQTFSLPTPAAVLAERVRHYETRFRVAEDSPAVTERLLQLMQQIPIGGKQVHDANIVATMLVHGVPRLLTANAGDFRRFSHLITIEPLA